MSSDTREDTDSRGSSPPSLLGKAVGGLGPRLLTFLLFLGLWTWKLLESNPVPESVTRGLSLDATFLLAKMLHAGVYAFLTVLAGLLPVRRRYFWLTVAMLALHAIGTEIGQTFVRNRSGSVRDVLIDWLGIGLGLLVVLLASGGRKPPE